MSRKVAAVIGAGPGVGMAVAKRFAREGFRVALVARRADSVLDYARSLRESGAEAFGFAGDASDFADMERTLGRIDEEAGHPDVLVYNAAVLKRAQPTELSLEQLLEEFKVNVAGALLCAKHVAPAMREKKQGTILLTGGGLALSPMPLFASLSIGKAAIRSLAFSLAGELGASGIHVATVTICGFVKAGTHFDPDSIAEAYWNLHTQEPPKWETEFVYR